MIRLTRKSQGRKLAGKTRQLHALFNNNYEDKAVRNAAQMKLMLD